MKVKVKVSEMYLHVFSFQFQSLEIIRQDGVALVNSLFCSVWILCMLLVPSSVGGIDEADERGAAEKADD